MKRNSFSASNPTIDIQLACEVLLTQSNSNTVVVEIDANEEDLAKFQVYQKGDTVYVRQDDYKQSGGGVTIIGDMVMGNISQSVFSSGGRNVVISGGNSFISSGRGGNVNIVSGGRSVQINNGRVIVDGQDVTDGGNVQDSKPAYRAPKIRIETPAGSNLVADLAGDSRLSSIVDLDDVSVSTQHSAVAEISKTNSADIDTSNGSSVSIAQVNGGSLIINTSNGSEAKVKGTFSSCQAISNNGSSIFTSGTCSGNYNATGNNGSSIRHSGTVSGRIREKANNASSVNIG
jgi:hypothetical protein